jgi:hypothetical protein
MSDASVDLAPASARACRYLPARVPHRPEPLLFTEKADEWDAHVAQSLIPENFVMK